jgi:hypothetical protein
MASIGTSPSALVPKAFLGLPRVHLATLTEFCQAGGVGKVSRQGRVIAGTPERPMSGNLHCWLDFVARGLVAGDGENLVLTAAGEQVAVNMSG